MSAEIGVARRPVWLRFLPALAVFASFTLDSFARYPVPAPNEPHYLCKAKHYWQPQWCAGDFFLESSNAHLVFYQTFGLLTRFVSLPTAAVIGRLIGLAILAAGWTAMIHRLIRGPFPPLWAAWVFLGLSALGSLSGEWLVGGIESKVVAYGFLFGAVACWLDDSVRDRKSPIIAAGLLAGIAISFHPVVGIWGVTAGLFATLADSVVGPNIQGGPSRPGVETPKQKTPAWVSVAAVLAMIVTATPGVLGALRVATKSSAKADYIQVYYRLAHHLDPMHFERLAWFGYGVLVIAWLVGRRWTARRDGERWFFWFVVGSGLIAAIGLADGWRSGPPEHMVWYPLRWKVLKLYPFRLFDALLPIAVAITVAGLARAWGERACRLHPSRKTLPAIWILCGLPALVAVLHIAPDARPPVTADELSDWFDVCRWVEEKTPPGSLTQIQPPQESWAFKWYAQQPEFVSYKDCPQDGPGIVEWNDRLLFLSGWADEHFYAGGFSRKATAPLAERGIKYLIVRKLGPFDFEPIYRNETFRVYDLQDGKHE